MCSSSLFSLPSLTSTFHHFMWLAAVEVVRGPSCSPSRRTMSRLFRSTFTTRYSPRNFGCSFNPERPCVLSIATKVSRLMHRRLPAPLVERPSPTRGRIDSSSSHYLGFSCSRLILTFGSLRRTRDRICLYNSTIRAMLGTSYKNFIATVRVLSTRRYRGYIRRNRFI